MASYEEMLMNQSDANSAFNASQAQINRDWQEYMSGTSHQRETKDLIAAGLNPVLSANSGSSWNAVSNATADPNSAAGQAALATTMLNNAIALEQSKISAEATKAAAGASAAATMYAAEQASSASRYAAERSNEGTHYSSDRSYAGSIETSPVGIAYQAYKGYANQASGGLTSSAYDVGTVAGQIAKNLTTGFGNLMADIGNMAGY